MKKLLAIIFAATMLAGCSDNSDKSSDSTNAKNEPFYIYYDRNNYENGYIYTTNDGITSFIDYETLESAPLCAIPNCNHSTASCVSQTVGSCPLIYNEYIYYFISDCGVNEAPDGRNFYIDSKLMRIKLDSSKAETVSEFHDAVPDTHDGFVVADDKLYFQADNMNPVENEYGMITYSNAGGIHFLCSIDLNTGEYTNYGSIYDGDKEFAAASSSSSANILGLLDNKLILKYSFLKEEIPDEKFEEEGFLMADQFTVETFEFDLTEKSVKPFETPVTFITDNDSYGYYDKETNSSVIVDNEQEITLENVRVSNYSILLNGKLWIYPDEPAWYDISDKSEHESVGYTEVIDYYNGKYIVKTRGMNFKAIAEEEL